MADVAIKTSTDETSTDREVRTHCPNCGGEAKRVSGVTLQALLKDEFAGQFAGTDQHSCGDSSRLEAGGFPEAGECQPVKEAGGCQPAKADTGWRFCNSIDCDVVYFSEQDDAAFVKSQLKVDVGVKETSGQRPLCYCFGHSVETMKQELRATGKSTALEDIRAKMKDPGCRCETENPSGSCCLGTVAKGLKVAQRELNISADDVVPPTSTDADPVQSKTSRGEKIATTGTLLSAIMASSCCWLPLVLLAVGVSGAGIAATLEAYRPLFIVVTFGFLGAAFYFTCRPTKGTSASADDCCAPPADAHDCCAPERAEHDCCSAESVAATKSVAAAGCCAPQHGRRFSTRALNKVMLSGVTALAVAFLLFPGYVGAFLGSDGKTGTEDMNRAVIKLDGLTCEACAAHVVNAVREVPGVLAVEVDSAKSEAVVGTEFCCPIPSQKILAAIRDAGYEGKVLKEIPARVNTSRSSEP